MTLDFTRRPPSRAARPAEGWFPAVGVLLVALVLAAAPSARASFALGLQDPGLIGDGSPAQAKAASDALGAVRPAIIRVSAIWAGIAPAGTRPPVGYRGSDPSDPRYRWTALDAEVRAGASHGARVMLEITRAPVWAEGSGSPSANVSPGAWNPVPSSYTAFVTALAKRYGGRFPDPLRPGRVLPRVAVWEPWNEPNIPGYFSAPHPVSAYRTLLADAYRVLKRANPSNVVVLGGLAPVSPVPGSTPPLDFAAGLLCLRRSGAIFRARQHCAPARFDEIGIHPYNFAATPTLPATKSGDVLVADLGTFERMVATADRLPTAGQPTHHGIWVDEWAWPTVPPDQVFGDAPRLAARFVAYSLYEMWRSGVSLVLWQTVLDEPGNALSGGGLYTSSGRPKPTLSAFIFPLFASVGGGRGYAWGRASSHGGRVTLQRTSGGRWRTVATARAGGDGVFTFHFAARGNGTFRALAPGGARSLPYFSAPIPARRIHLTGG